jgi:ATP-dependent Zn protease
VEGLNFHDGSSKMRSTLPSSAIGRGLDKVAGMHALKELLRSEVVVPIRNPEPYRRYGLSIPNGILLYGPPGCGKTYIARQLAEELGHYFVEIIPSELASSYVHQSVIRIRELFDTAAEQAPAVIFIDEFEALVPTRGELGGHQHYKAEKVNEFLAHLNSCAEKKIFVIAATNQPKKSIRRCGGRGVLTNSSMLGLQMQKLAEKCSHTTSKAGLSQLISTLESWPRFLSAIPPATYASW